MTLSVSRFAPVIALCAVIGGCSGSGDTAPNDGPPANVQGMWLASLHNFAAPGLSSSCSFSDVIVTLNQNGESFSGSYEHEGGGTCGALGAGVVLGGSLAENSISFNVDDSDARFTGTVAGRTMSGTGAIVVDLGPSGTHTLRGLWDAIRRPTPTAEGTWMFSYTVWDPADQFRHACYVSGVIVTLSESSDTARVTSFGSGAEAPGFTVTGTERNGSMRCEWIPDLAENQRLGDPTETPIQSGFNQAEVGLLSMDVVSHLPDIQLSSGDVARPDGIIHLYQGKVHHDWAGRFVEIVGGRAAMTMRFSSGAAPVMMEGGWQASRL